MSAPVTRRSPPPSRGFASRRRTGGRRHEIGFHVAADRDCGQRVVLDRTPLPPAASALRQTRARGTNHARMIGCDRPYGGGAMCLSAADVEDIPHIDVDDGEAIGRSGRRIRENAGRRRQCNRQQARRRTREHATAASDRSPCRLGPRCADRPDWAPAAPAFAAVLARRPVEAGRYLPPQSQRQASFRLP